MASTRDPFHDRLLSIMRLDRKPNWHEVESLIVQSYRIVAPKKRVAELDAATGTKAAPAAKKASAKRAPTRKAVPRTKSRAAQSRARSGS